MDSIRIRELLKPFVTSLELNDSQYAQFSTHLDLLLKWNARMNLTSVRDPEQLMVRHFGESLFAAAQVQANCPHATSLVDLGSGAGFPGIPIKIALPKVKLTLVESQQKKATFLREVVRALKMPGAQVLNSRAETLELTADVVSLRAVENFTRILPIAEKLVADGGCLALLIGAGQSGEATSLLPHFTWDEPRPIPLSERRVVLTGTQA